MSQLEKKFTPIKSGFKALILDCDGTLTESKRDALPTIAVVNAVKKATAVLHVGIATQRDIANTKPILKYLHLTGPSIISGGAQIIDSKSFRIIREEVIKTHSLNKVIEILEEFKKERGLPFFIQESDGEDIDPTKNYIPRKPITVFLGGLTFEQADYLKKKLLEIDNIAVNKVVPWESKFGVVITGVLATKQHGIFEVAKILGINTHEIIGVGDGYNDFPLLMACGLKIAMGNAVDDLKAIADYIAPSVEEDGVVDVINKFIL